MPAKKVPQSVLPGTLVEAVRYFSDLDVATDFVAKLRWPDGPICPTCGGKEHSYISTRRLWKCKKAGCRRQFSVKVGTIFEDSAIRLDKWLVAIWMLTNCKNGIVSTELARTVGVTQKSAWFMLHRIRLAMQSGSIEKHSDKFDGAVEVDETYIGGKARNMHPDRRKSRGLEGRGSNFAGKTGVMGILERGGEVRMQVIDDTRKASPPDRSATPREVGRDGYHRRTQELSRLGSELPAQSDQSR